MIFALLVILLILALVGGVAVHPLLFIVAVLLLVALFANLRGTRGPPPY